MNHLNLLYVDLVERSNYLKSKEAEEKYSDLEIEIRTDELVALMLLVSKSMAKEANQTTAFSKN